MPRPHPDRPSLAYALAGFVPAWLLAALALPAVQPLTLLPLLLADALALAAACHALGFGFGAGQRRVWLRSMLTALMAFVLYAAVVFALTAWPLLRLLTAPSLGAALLLATALVTALALLWPLWPVFGLCYLWDDAYAGAEGVGAAGTALPRCIAFAHHLARGTDRFVTLFVPAALALLALSFGALSLSALGDAMSPELHAAALALYAVLLPLASLVLVNRTLKLMWAHPREAVAEAAPANALPLLTAAEQTPGAREAALLEAARRGEVERALALLEAGADANAAPAEAARDRRPALQLAALLPDTRLLRELIARGATINRTEGGISALLAACRDSWHGRAEAVMTLLANGADPRQADAEGRTPLHGATLSGDPGVAAMLLDAGASVDALDRAGQSPLTAACRAANWTLAAFLLEHGARPQPAEGEPALVAAAGIAEDDIAGVRLLLKHRADVNARDRLGRTALMAAALEGHVAIVRALLAAGADVALSDRNGTTALMEAARAGAHAVLMALAEARPDAGARDAHGRDALILACQSPRSHADTVRALLALGADAHRTAADARSALDHAAGAGRWDLVAVLDPDTPLPASLAGGAEPEPGADTPGHLQDALRFGHWAVVSAFAGRVRDWPPAQRAALYRDLCGPGHDAARRWLLDHGLDVETALADGVRLFDALLERLPDSAEAIEDLLTAGATPAGAGRLARALAHLDGAPQGAALAPALLERGADPFGTDPGGHAPLQLAAATGQLQTLQALLARGCDPNARDPAGRTPLHAALGRPASAALPLVRALIAAGADPEIAAGNGETPLGLALAQGDPALTRWLRWNGWALPRRLLRAEDLPAAAASGDLDAVQRLLELGFAVDSRDAQGASALLRACGAGQRSVAEHLLAAGADPALAAHGGASCLAAAVSARREALVELLLARAVVVDQSLPGAATALMLAAALGFPEILERLLAAGADVHARDAQGQTALHAAARFAFGSRDSLRARRVMDALLKRGANADATDAGGLTPLLLLVGAHMRPGAECDPTHLGALLPLLLDAGAAAAAADRRGVSALHACAMHALLGPARALLLRGAPRDVLDSFGRSPADVAHLLGYSDLALELSARALPTVNQTLRRPATPSE